MDTPAKPPIDCDAFARLDLRVGRVVQVLPFPRARAPSYKVELDLGPLGRRWSSAQLAHYAPEALLGTLVVAVVNMPPRNVAGFPSEVLILGARGETGEVVLLTPRVGVAPGESVF